MTKRMQRICCAILLLAATLAIDGCHKTSETADSSKQPAVTAPLAIIVIDHTGSTMQYRSKIKAVCKAFLDSYANDQDTDIRIIRLDSRPEPVMYISQGRMRDEDWKDFDKKFAGTGPDGEGTDQVGAMELIATYAKGTASEKPEEVSLCYFSDMIDDQPKGKPAAFKSWKDWHWKTLADLKVKAGFYFVNTDKHSGPTLDMLQSAAAAEGFRPIWHDAQQTNTEVQNGDVTLPN